MSSDEILQLARDHPELVWPAIREVLYENRDRLIWIYAIQAGEAGPVKIGISRSPKQRLVTLQQANPERLRPLACWRDLPETEKVLHREFAAVRLAGEWFKPTPEVLALGDQYGISYDGWDE